MTRTRAVLVVLTMLAVPGALRAHSGPPFPIVSDATRGPYTISVWTDPDATDDGAPGGQFWIVIGPAAQGLTIPPDTRATLWVKARTTNAPAHTTRAEPVRGNVTNQFGAVVMDHEGPFEVHVEVNGALGHAAIDSMVDATYDLRPPPYMLIWYLVPFLMAGFLWTRLLLRRRAAGHSPSAGVHAP